MFAVFNRLIRPEEAARDLGRGHGRHSGSCVDYCPSLIGVGYLASRCYDELARSPAMAGLTPAARASRINHNSHRPDNLCPWYINNSGKFSGYFHFSDPVSYIAAAFKKTTRSATISSIAINPIQQPNDASCINAGPLCNGINLIGVTNVDDTSSIQGAADGGGDSVAVCDRRKSTYGRIYYGMLIIQDWRKPAKLLISL